MASDSDNLRGAAERRQAFEQAYTVANDTRKAEDYEKALGAAKNYVIYADRCLAVQARSTSKALTVIKGDRA